MTKNFLILLLVTGLFVLSRQNCLTSTNSCNNNGRCTKEGFCICNTYYSGESCEIVAQDQVEFKDGQVKSAGIALIVLFCIFIIPGIFILINWYLIKISKKTIKGQAKNKSNNFQFSAADLQGREQPNQTLGLQTMQNQTKINHTQDVVGEINQQASSIQQNSTKIQNPTIINNQSQQKIDPIISSNPFQQNKNAEQSVAQYSLTKQNTLFSKLKTQKQQLQQTQNFGDNHLDDQHEEESNPQSERHQINQEQANVQSYLQQMEQSLHQGSEKQSESSKTQGYLDKSGNNFKKSGEEQQTRTNKQKKYYL